MTNSTTRVSILQRHHRTSTTTRRRGGTCKSHHDTVALHQRRRISQDTEEVRSGLRRRRNACCPQCGANMRISESTRCGRHEKHAGHDGQRLVKAHFNTAQTAIGFAGSSHKQTHNRTAIAEGEEFHKGRARFKQQTQISIKIKCKTSLRFRLQFFKLDKAPRRSLRCQVGVV